MAKNKEKASEVKSLTLSNGQIRLLAEWLEKRSDGMPLLLHGSKARARNRFYILIGPRLKEIEERKTELAEQYSKKDKEGKIKFKEDGVTYDIAEDKQEAVNKEITSLFAEEYVIDILPSNRETLVEIKEMFLNLDRDFDMQGGAIYSFICEELEKSI